METKNSKVTAVTLKKEGTGQHGKYFIFTVVFENGDTGDFVSKTNPQSKFTQGQTTDYTKEVVQNGQYTNVKINTVQQGNGFKPQSPLSANRRSALESSARMGGTDEVVLTRAEKFDAWLNKSDQPKSELKKETPPPIEEIPEWLRD